MPKIPFLEQQLLPSANVGAVRVDPGMRSGEFAALRQIGGAVRQIGDVAADYGLKLKQAKATDQRIQGETKAMGALDEIQNGFRTRRDHAAFAADFDTQAAALKEKLLGEPDLEPEAKKSLSSWYDRQALMERAKVQSLAFAKWQDQSRAGLDLALADAEKRGDSGRAEAALAGAKAAGYITDQEYEAKRQAVGRNLDYYAALSDIESGQGMNVYNHHLENGFYQELMPEDKQKLETYGARLEKAHLAAVADAVEGNVLEVTSTGQYDAEAELAKVDAAESSGAIDKKTGASLRDKLRVGDIEKTSNQIQAKLNTLEMGVALGQISPEEGKAALIGYYPKATSKDAGRIVSFFKEIQSGQEQAEKAVPPVLKEAYSQIDELRKTGVFGDRVIDKKGRDITEEERRKVVKFVEAGGDKPGAFTGRWTEEEAAQENAKRRKGMQQEWDKQDQAYNDAVSAVRDWAKENPKATPEQAREAIRGILALPLENAAFQKAMGK